MLTAEQILDAHKVNVNQLFGYSAQAFAGVEKLVALNLSAGRAALAESAAHTKALLAAKDAQEVAALNTQFVQPLAEKSAAYGREVYDIASKAGSSLSKDLEGKAAEGQQAFHAYLEGALRNAPAGADQAVALVKQAMSASTAAAESVQKAVKQAVSMAETSVQNATNTAVKAAKGTSKKR